MAKKKTAQKKKRGRPPGAKTLDRDVVDVVVSKCKCGSTKRTPYCQSPKRLPRKRDPHGNPCNEVVLRHTKCLDCGQARIDRSYE